MIEMEKIVQISGTQFKIHWNDGTQTVYTLAELQRSCPCAKCRSGLTEMGPAGSEVTAKRITSVGRYAIRIEFSSGCSLGIYTYDMLYTSNHLQNKNS